MADVASYELGHFIGDATAIILNSFQDYRATLGHRTYRPLFEAMSIPIQLYDSELPRGRTVRHPIGFTAVDIFQVRSEDFGDRRARAFLNASYIFLSPFCIVWRPDFEYNIRIIR